MSTASDPLMILSSPPDKASPLSFSDEDIGLTTDLRVRFVVICGVALAAFAILLSLANTIAKERFSVSGERMIVERAHVAAMTAMMAEKTLDDHGPAAKRALATAASDIRGAVEAAKAAQEKPLAMGDHKASALIAKELAIWAERVETLAVAQKGAAEIVARAALCGIEASDLLPCLNALADQTKHRAQFLARAELALRVVGLAIVCAVLVFIWIAVIRPFSNRQHLVRKRLRRNEFAARELAAQAAQADEAKANFLSVISHELRTPMNGILGCAELIRVAAGSERDRALATTICESGTDLMTIVTDILDFTDMKSGEFELFDGVVDADQLVEDVKAKFGCAAQAARARLEVTLIGDPDRTRRGDMARITQILSNITDNAIRFTQGGAVYVTIDNRFPRALMLTVRDTGVGMTPPEVARAFTPFSQADAGATRMRGGAGMGLTIVKKLVDAMGGDVRLQSRAGAGTTLTVSVPLPFGEGRLEREVDCPPPSPVAKAARRLKLTAA